MILAQMASFLLLWKWYLNTENYVAACKLMGYYPVKSLFAQLGFYLYCYNIPRASDIPAYEYCK